MTFMTLNWIAFQLRCVLLAAGCQLAAGLHEMHKLVIVMMLHDIINLMLNRVQLIVMSLTSVDVFYA